jgi:hypothetical protein
MSKSQLSDPSADMGTPPRRSRVVAFLALGSLALAPLALAVPAGASGSTIGTYKFSGEVSGTAKSQAQFSGKYGLKTYSCQVQQESNQILLQMVKPSLTVNGKKTTLTSLQITVGVGKDGAAETIGGSSEAQVTLTTASGTKNSEWTSTSGTATVKPKGNGASFAVVMAPAGSLSGNPVQSGDAKSSVHLSGTVTSCHPFEQ